MKPMKPIFKKSHRTKKDLNLLWEKFCTNLGRQKMAFQEFTEYQDYLITESGNRFWSNSIADDKHRSLFNRFNEVDLITKKSAFRLMLSCFELSKLNFKKVELESFWQSFISQYDFIISILDDREKFRPVNQPNLNRVLIFNTLISEIGFDIFLGFKNSPFKKTEDSVLEHLALMLNPFFHIMLGVTETIAFCFSKDTNLVNFNSEESNLKILKKINTDIEKIICTDNLNFGSTLEEIDIFKKIIKKQIDIHNVLIHWREEVKRCLDLEIRANILPATVQNDSDRNSETLIKELLIRSFESLKKLNFKAYSNFDDTLKPILRDEKGKYISSSLYLYEYGKFKPRDRGAHKKNQVAPDEDKNLLPKGSTE